MPDQYLATHSDGAQTLVTLWDDTDGPELGEVAYRPTAYAAWGIPTPLVAAL